MPTYKINSTGNTILADLVFMDAVHHDDYTLIPEPPAPPEPVDPFKWFMYVGPFKDRLGMDALAIAASTHDACKAVMGMLVDRKYVDLQGTQVANMLNILIATNQPTANAMFPGSGPMTTTKRDAIISVVPSDLERYKGAA